MLTITASVALFAAGTLISIVAMIGMLAISLATHPLITIAYIINRITSLASAVSLLMLIATLGLCDRSDTDFMPTILISAGILAAGSVIAALTERFIERTGRSGR